MDSLRAAAALGYGSVNDGSIIDKGTTCSLPPQNFRPHGPPHRPRTASECMAHVCWIGGPSDTSNSRVGGSHGYIPNNSKVIASKSSALVGSKNPNVIEEVDRCGLKGKQTYVKLRQMDESKSSIRERLPRGRTRNLASMFEVISEEANHKMTLEQVHLRNARRGKSVPANNFRRRLDSEENSRKSTTDDNPVTKKFVKDDSANTETEDKNVSEPKNNEISKNDRPESAKPSYVRQIASQLESSGIFRNCSVSNFSQGNELFPTPRSSRSSQEPYITASENHVNTKKNLDESSIQKDSVKISSTPQRNSPLFNSPYATAFVGHESMKRVFEDIRQQNDSLSDYQNTPRRYRISHERFSTPLDNRRSGMKNFKADFFGVENGQPESCDNRLDVKQDVTTASISSLVDTNGGSSCDVDCDKLDDIGKAQQRYFYKGWDEDQYETGRRKGQSIIRAYSQNQKQVEVVLKEVSFGQDSSIPDNHVYAVPDGEYYDKESLEQHICCAECENRDRNRLDVDEVDHIAVVDKAFEFMQAVDDVDNTGDIVSQVSPRAKTHICAEQSQSPQCRLAYTTSKYRELEKQNQTVSEENPIGYSPVICTIPSLEERAAALSEFGKKNKNSIMSPMGFQEVLKQASITRGDPMATSTPIGGSPSSRTRRQLQSSRVLGPSPISTINSSILADPCDERQVVIQEKKISEAMAVLEIQMAQASDAIARCKRNSSFNGTMMELSAQRVLLLSRERQFILNQELQRLRAMHITRKFTRPCPNAYRGAFDVDSIILYLNRNFCVRNTDEHDTYAFMVLFKTNEQVDATQTLTLMDTRTLRVSTVHFSDHIRFTKLPVDFVLSLEVYAMKIREVPRAGDRKCPLLRNKAKSLLNHTKKPSLESSVVGTSGFTRCGYMCLNQQTVGSKKFYLDSADYPLDGTIEIRTRCTILPPVIDIEFCGFLNMYEEVSGLASWMRYWAVLRQGAIDLWKYPDEESNDKPPVNSVDLMKCNDDKIVPTDIEICSRPNSFSIDLLFTNAPSEIEHKRVLLSADTKELCIAWLRALNDTLDVIRRG